MASLDIATASAIAGCNALSVAIMLWIMGRSIPRTHAQGYELLTLGMLCFGTAFLIISEHEQLPRWMSPVIANSLLVLAFVPFGVVLRRLLGLSTRTAVGWGVAAVATCAIANAWLLEAQTSINLRLIIGSGCQLLVTAFILSVPWQIAADRRTTGVWLVFGSFAVFALLVCYRIIFFSLGGPMPSIFSSESMQSLSYLTAALLPLMAGIAFVQLYAQFAQDNFRRLAQIDPLTGCLNRRALGEAFDRLAGEPGRGPLTLLVIDVDNLKLINDNAGHMAGDAALIELSGQLKASLKGSIIARVGGDEFVAILKEEFAQACILAETFQSALASKRSPRMTVSCSMGAAQLLAGEDMQSVWARADDAMYRQKRGRQCAASLQTSLI
jgi:diguanylate cyclase (GGDEF)-like protein